MKCFDDVKVGDEVRTLAGEDVRITEIMDDGGGARLLTVRPLDGGPSFELDEMDVAVNFGQPG